MRRAFRLLALIVLTAGSGTLPASAAAAPQLSVTPRSGAAGDLLNATVSGFQPGSVSLHVDGIPGILVTTIHVDSTATHATAFAIPVGLAAGEHMLLACRDQSGSACRELARAPFEVLVPPPVIVTPTTAPTATTVTTPPTTSPAIAIATTTTTTATTTTAPVLVTPTTTSTTTTTNPADIAISTTSEPPTEAQPEGEIVPDVFVRGVEVTQGIQDLQSRMPLVADRRTTVRVHVGADPELAAVDGALLVERQGAADEVLLPDNGPILTTTERADIDGALNFTLEPHHYAPGQVTFTAQVWSAGYASIGEEPDSDNNLMTQPVEFHPGQNLDVRMIMLDDGDGPGPPITMSYLLALSFASVVQEGLLDYFPVAGVNFQTHPSVVGPGPEATVANTWVLDVPKSGELCPDPDLGLAVPALPEEPGELDELATPPENPCVAGNALRHEPNVRMRWIAEDAGFYGDGLIVGRLDGAVPTGGWSGWASKGVAWSKPSPGTAAHEAGHRSGLKHVGCKGTESGPDPAHPTGLPPVCSLAPIDPDGYFGFTNYREPVVIYSNDPDHPQAAFPMMGYRNPGWTDPYHWCLLLARFGVPCVPEEIGVPPKVVDPEVAFPGIGPPDLVLDDGTTVEIPLESEERPEGWLVVSGWIDPVAATGSIGQAATREHIAEPTFDAFADAVLAATTPSEPGTVAAPPELMLRLTDADGVVLMAAPIALDGGHDDDQDGAEGFFSPIPWVDGAAAIELLVDGAVADNIAIAPSAPELTGVEVFPNATGTRVTWTVDEATAADDDATFTVLWSNDGETWIPAAVDVTGDEVTIPASSPFPGGDDVQVRVIANAGVRTASAMSEPFSAPRNAPVVSIAGGTDEPIEQFDVVELRAIAADPDHPQADGTENLRIVWDGPIGSSTGPVLSTRDLPLGSNPITVTVVDPDGDAAAATIVIDVVARTSPTRSTESLDPAAVEFLTTEFTAPTTTTTTTTVDDLAEEPAGLVAVAAGGRDP